MGLCVDTTTGNIRTTTLRNAKKMERKQTCKRVSFQMQLIVFLLLLSCSVEASPNEPHPFASLFGTMFTQGKPTPVKTNKEKFLFSLSLSLLPPQSPPFERVIDMVEVPVQDALLY